MQVLMAGRPASPILYHHRSCLEEPGAVLHGEGNSVQKYGSARACCYLYHLAETEIVTCGQREGAQRDNGKLGQARHTY